MWAGQLRKIVPNVSRETFLKFELYKSELLKWQKSINLIGSSTMDDVEGRHFLDSAQLYPYIAEKEILLDLGSGAGFPGVVFALLCPSLQVNLVEIDQKKAAFLRHIKTILSLENVKVHAQDLKEIQIENVDVITARALSALINLLKWTETLRTPCTEYCVLKGRSWREELLTAQETYDFVVENFPSITDCESALIRIKQVVRK